MTSTSGATAPKPTSTWLQVWSLTRMGITIAAATATTLGYTEPQSLGGLAPASTVGGQLVLIGVAVWNIAKNLKVTQDLIAALQAPAVTLK